MQNRARHALLGTLLIVVAVTIVAAYFLYPRGTANTPFRIAFNTWVGYGPFYVAQQKGFFKDEGVNVELQRIEGTGDRRAALIAKRIEALGTTIDDLVVGASEGVPAKMVLAIDESAGADGIVAVNSIHSIQDLKGKTVAVQPGFVNHFFLLYLLDEAGISPRDIRIEAMEPDAAGLAFIAGKIDVAVTWEPHLSKAKERPDGHVLITTADPAAQGIIVDNLIVRDDVIKADSREVEGIIRAWFRAVEYMKTHPEEANTIIGAAFGLNPSEVGEMLSGVRLLNAPMNKSFFVHTFSKVAAKAADLYYGQKLITNKPDIQGLLDESFIDKITK